MAQYSNGPKETAKSASGGARNTRTILPMTPPTRDAKMPVARALPASPRRVMGVPSKQVAMEDGVPGMFSNIADKSPPEIPPV